MLAGTAVFTDDRWWGACLIAASHWPSTPRRLHALLPVDDRLPASRSRESRIQECCAVSAQAQASYPGLAKGRNETHRDLVDTLERGMQCVKSQRAIDLELFLGEELVQGCSCGNELLRRL